MQIVPVLDLLKGQVVRGIAGRREEYRPIVSRWTPSAEPLEVARALHQAFGFTSFYVADLDAILGGIGHLDVIRALLAAGYTLRVDAGIRHELDAQRLVDAVNVDLIVGLETVASPEELSRIAKRVGPEKVIFSIDLKSGRPISSAVWPALPRVIADAAIASGVRRLLILDLAKVGVGEGVGTEDLCQDLRDAYPDLEISAGGGVRGMEDLQRLKALGIDSALVASALHDGRLSAAVVARFSNEVSRVETGSSLRSPPRL